MRIADIRATPVTVPLEAPLRHANGCHWGRFVRTIVEVETDDGLVGLGEMGGGGESATAAFRALKPYLVGPRPGAPRGDALPGREPDRVALQQPHAGRWPRSSSRASTCSGRTGACRSPRSSAAACATACRSPPTSSSATRTRGAAPARSARPSSSSRRPARSRRRTASPPTSSRAGSSRRSTSSSATARWPTALPGDRFRFDPNGVWSAEQAIWFGQQIEGLRNDYLEDPVFGLHGMRRVREKVRMPLATNTVVVNFEQLAANVLDTAVDVILLDTTFWGGIRPCVKAAGICETFQLGVAVHSSGELGIQLATMLHLGAVLPNLTFAADAHYHHLADDVIEGGQAEVRGRRDRGARPGPASACGSTARSWREYHELFRRLGPYPYDQDPLRPGWTPLVPNDRWADPADARVPEVPAVRRARARAGAACSPCSRVAAGGARAEDGYELWLRYRPGLRPGAAEDLPRAAITGLAIEGDSPTLRAAREELRPRPPRPARAGASRSSPGRDRDGAARGRHAARSALRRRRRTSGRTSGARPRGLRHPLDAGRRASAPR